MATAYLTLAQWKDRTTMSPGDVDALERKRPGFVGIALGARSATINARLTKRYAVPFQAHPDTPEIVLVWLTDLVSLDAYKALGFSPSSEQDELIVAAAQAAESQLAEAANAETGLFELPLRETSPGGSGVEKGGPYAYSEPGPYHWLDAQREAVRDGRG